MQLASIGRISVKACRLRCTYKEIGGHVGGPGDALVVVGREAEAGEGREQCVCAKRRAAVQPQEHLVIRLQTQVGNFLYASTVDSF